ncbi:uncharacterized protein LOC129659367 isoform X9 [Bubalus kerabau]|uniref:uncharacterized protein LOC129659367 isoform X9 n=1 Tax=Bubalus carabanensis TaxID=3119969 RepID=UPI00244E7F8B|nr:uncharacterized protein LOC129659367 isoform X9 [Bubalus carabanensis]
MHSLPLCCPGKTVYSYLISQWDILLEDRGQHLEAVRRRMAAHQASPSLGFSMQEHWSGLPFPSPMRESESESEVAQSYPTLSDPMDCGPLGSSIHGIFQITHAGGIQQPCADDADAACGEEPEDSSQQLAQGLTEKITICKPGRGLSSELDHTGTLTTVFPVSRTVGNKLL